MLDKLSALQQEELDYIISSKFLEKFPGLREDMDTPKYTVSNLGVAARDATYWDKKGILPELEGKPTTRRKYTLKQAVWIKLIQQMRSLDISLNQIGKIKDNLLVPRLNIRELFQDERVKLAVTELAKKLGTPGKYNELITDPNIFRELELEQMDHFEYVIYYAILFRTEVSYIISVDGECIPYDFMKHDKAIRDYPQLTSVLKSAHLVLSVTQAISQLIQDSSENKWLNNMSIITEDEKKVLALLREKSTKELIIKKKGNVPERVIVVQQDEDIESIKKFANHIVRSGYQTMIVKTRQGKTMYFRNEISIKLRDIPEAPDH